MRFQSIKKYKKLYLVVSAIFVTSIVLFVNEIWLYGLTVILLLMFWINYKVYKATSYNATHLFSTIGRNYRCLIIGEVCDLSPLKFDLSECICFLSPARRSMLATKELIKRLYSLLDEDKGHLYIILRKESVSNTKISVFDIPYLHEITMNLLKIRYMKLISKFPLFMDPISCARYLLKLNCSSDLVEADCPSKEISDFCQERNIVIHFYYIKS